MEPRDGRVRERMTRLRLATVLFLCTGLTSLCAHAGDKQEAEKHFRAGVSLQKVEDFEAAIAAFEASLRLHPTKSALFNLANCLRATHRYGEAIQAFERLQREYGDTLDAPMREAVERQLRELRNLSASLALEVEPDGAEVLIDGKLVGRAPLAEPLLLSPGLHDVEVRLEGYEPARIRIDLVSRQRADRRITLTETEQAPPPPVSPPPPKPETAPVAGPAPQPPPRPDDQGSSFTTVGWITTGAGLAMLAAGTATGIWALSVDDGLQDDCIDGHCPPGRGSDIDKLETLTTTTNVLMGVGLAVSATGVVMLLSDTPRDREPERTTVGLSWGPGQLGTSLQQRF